MDVANGALEVVRRLQQAGFEAYIVGGAVRDQVLSRTPKDVDITTSARPEQVMALFERVIPTGLEFGTVTVLGPDHTGYEVTTFRADGDYSDGRHPNQVVYSQTVTEDLARRDLTINAMAWDPVAGVLVDPFGGRQDLADGIIRAVGDPRRRFEEDSLRMLRAVRFAARYGFRLDPATFEAIAEMADKIARVSVERIAKELFGVLISAHADVGLRLLAQTGLLARVLPEMALMVGYDQNNPHHKLDLFEHTVAVVMGVPAEEGLRLAALLHDVGKPSTRSTDEAGISHYFGHAEVGAEMADAICRRLHLSNEIRLRAVALIREHMLPEEGGPRMLRRLLAKYGVDLLRQLVDLREADLLASSGSTGKLRVTLAQVIQERGAAESFRLAITGQDVMDCLGIGPGPDVGRILAALKEAVLDDPGKNTREALLEMVKEFAGA